MKNLILEKFYNLLECNPERKIIKTDRDSYTVSNLEKMSTCLSERWAKDGVSKGDRLVVQVPRGIELFAVIFAIIKLGGVYIPIEMDVPEERCEYIKEDSGAKFHVLFEDNSISLIHLASPSPNSSSLGAGTRDNSNDLYIIYTSGTTGKPKGVVVSDENVSNTVDSCVRGLSIRGGNFLFKTTISFDVSVFEMYVFLFSEVTIFCLSDSLEKDPQKIIDFIIKNRISIITYVPSAFRYFLKFINTNSNSNSNLKIEKILLAGENPERTLVSEVIKLFPKAEIWNLYGPTEDTIYSSIFKIESADYISIGKPIDGEQIVIVDKGGEKCKLGKIGQIVISGKGISRGYTDKTLEKGKFDKSSSNIYYTGDLGYIDQNNNIVYIGRNDDEIKIGGHRVNLLMISDVVSQKFEQLEFKILKIKDSESEFLCMFYKDYDISIPILHEKLEQILPTYMIPSKIIKVFDFPLRQSGKIDDIKLRQFFIKNSRSSIKHYEGETSLSKELLKSIWMQVLGIRDLSYDESFFFIGGTSLNVLDLVLEIEQVTGIKLSTSDIYENDTINYLFSFLKQRPVIREIGIVENLSEAANTCDISDSVKEEMLLESSHFESLSIVFSEDKLEKRISDLLNFKINRIKNRKILSFSVHVKCRSDAELRYRLEMLIKNQEAFLFQIKTSEESRERNRLFVRKLSKVVFKVNDVSQFNASAKKRLVSFSLDNMKREMSSKEIGMNSLVDFQLFKYEDRSYVLNVVMDHLISDMNTPRIIRRFLNKKVGFQKYKYSEYLSLFLDDKLIRKSFEKYTNSIFFSEYLVAFTSFFDRFSDYYQKKSFIFSKPTVIRCPIVCNGFEQACIFLDETLKKIFNTQDKLPIRVFTNPREFFEKNFYNTIGDFSDSLLCVTDSLYESYIRNKDFQVKNNLSLKHFIHDVEWSRKYIKKSPISLNYFDNVTKEEELRLLKDLNNTTKFKYPIQVYNVEGEFLTFVFQNGVPSDLNVVLNNNDHSWNHSKKKEIGKYDNKWKGLL